MHKQILITANSAKEASLIYCARRDQSGEGASTFPNGIWNGHTISYNGRVWEQGKTWPDAKLVYCPSEDQSETAETRYTVFYLTGEATTEIAILDAQNAVTSALKWEEIDPNHRAEVWHVNTKINRPLWGMFDQVTLDDN